MQPRWIDTHCHLTSEEFAGDVPPTLERAAAAGVAHCITIGTTPADARAALALAGAFPTVRVGAGIHPHQAGPSTDADLADLRAIFAADDAQAGATRSRQRVVALGEIGLDFHYNFAPAERQEQVFRTQLALAQAVDRPVVIHARQAEERCRQILAEFPGLRGRVVFHCFSAEAAVAERILADGHWLSFTGVLTFKNADATRASLRATPDDRLMLETDAPYMSPEPVRRVRRCEPAFVVHTGGRAAEVRNTTPAALAALTTANAVRFFGLPEA